MIAGDRVRIRDNRVLIGVEAISTLRIITSPTFDDDLAISINGRFVYDQQRGGLNAGFDITLRPGDLSQVYPGGQPGTFEAQPQTFAQFPISMSTGDIVRLFVANTIAGGWQGGTWQATVTYSTGRVASFTGGQISSGSDEGVYPTRYMPPIYRQLGQFAI